MNEQQRLSSSFGLPVKSALEGSSLQWHELLQCGNQVRRKGDLVSPVFSLEVVDDLQLSQLSMANITAKLVVGGSR